MVKYTYSFLILFLGNLIIAQTADSESQIDRFGIKKIKEYLHVVHSDGSIGDSIGIQVTTFDSLGRIKRKTSLDTAEQRINDYEYDYVYDQNSNLIELKVNPTNRSFTLMSMHIMYDQYGNKRLEKQFRGGELREETEYFYNSKNQLRREHKTKYFPKKSDEKLFYLYNDNGNLYRKIMSNRRLEISEFRYDEHDNPIYERLIENDNQEKYSVESIFDQRNKKIKDKFYLHTSMQIPDIYSNIYASKGDVWVIEYQYNTMGLLISKKQWLNDVFIGIKKYKYEI